MMTCVCGKIVEQEFEPEGMCEDCLIASGTIPADADERIILGQFPELISFDMEDD